MNNQRPPINFNKFKPWLIVAVASFFFFYNFLQMNMLDVLGNFFINKFNISSPVSFSFFSSLFLYTNVLFFLPAGIIIDKYSTRKILIYAALVYVCSSLLLYGSSSLWEAETSRILAGIAGSFSFLSCVKLANQWVAKKDIGKAIGFSVTFGLLGGLIASYPLAVFYNFFGGNFFLLVNLLLGIFIFVLILSVVEEKKQINERTLKLDKSLLDVFKNHINWHMGLYIGFLNLPILVLGALWGTKYLNAVDFIDGKKAASIVGMIFLGSIFGMPFFGWLTDYMKKRRKPMLLGALLSLTTVLVIIILGRFLNYTFLIFFFFLLGFVTSSQVIGYPVMSDKNKKTQIAAATAISAIIAYACGGFGQILFGWILQEISPNKVSLVFSSNLGYEISILILPVSFLFAALISFIVKESYNS